jgi:hypothetical protein
MYSNCGALLDVVLKENLKGRRLRTKSNKENIKEPSKIELFKTAQNTNIIPGLSVTFRAIFFFFAVVVIGGLISL